MSDSTPFTDDGLVDLGNVEYENNGEANLAYIFETELQKNSIDPSFDSRTNAINRLVHRAFPNHRQTVFPVVIVKHFNTTTRMLGSKGGHAIAFLDYKIRIEGEQKPNVQKLHTQAQRVLTGEAVNDSLIAVDMNYHPENLVISGNEVSRDPSRSHRFYQEFVVRYFTLIQND